jgi:hypothetical protein
MFMFAIVVPALVIRISPAGVSDEQATPGPTLVVLGSG